MARTTVTNHGSVPKYFGFIPPHGAQLQPGQSVVLDGDIRSVLAGGRGRYTRRRELAALNHAVAIGDIHEVPTTDSSSSH